MDAKITGCRAPVRTLLASLLAGGALFGATQASAATTYTYTFDLVPPLAAVNVGTALRMDVTAVGNVVQFEFKNNSSTTSVIDEVFWDFGTTGLFPSYVDGKLPVGAIGSGSGTSFESPSNPANLPRGATISFDADASAQAKSPGPKNGINDKASTDPKPQDYQDFKLTLASTYTLDDVITALNAGTLRVGLHVQGFTDPYATQSDSYVNCHGNSCGAVPLPAAAWLFGSALVGFVSLSNRRKVS